MDFLLDQQKLFIQYRCVTRLKGIATIKLFITFVKPLFIVYFIVNCSLFPIHYSLFCDFMDITINTPALFFPAISLVMLAYTNRFLGLASVIRNLHTQYIQNGKKEAIHRQIRTLKYRLKLIKNMQAFGVLSFLSCIASMYFIYINSMAWANLLFGAAMLAFTFSLIISLLEIKQSTKALELEISDMDNMEDPTIVEYIKKKFERE